MYSSQKAFVITGQPLPLLKDLPLKEPLAPPPWEGFLLIAVGQLRAICPCWFQKLQDVQQEVESSDAGVEEKIENSFPSSWVGARRKKASKDLPETVESEP